ncbi:MULTISPECIES: TraR/DksA family transcriptional regulator [unclassified Pseudodesulfovibrio]|uniref:TraR/DksA family transcriptional regulator n=1 Tax=unclassified Pseudodesulfovibrio TaxID=2661612 RepID=UPI000FEBE653|nr:MULTISPECIES: TraR/DksA family transcriptional regulator [unclassified Pseudodesulfovibrio]MCJ2164655.1 TraR/DksA family transcriptional regulator [Pseudodesulfovibrio sp. S3-i]RWU04153.1 TraR/DksA family transcriptional regulator [Pseudodesulfovibrio sp. S3]
MADFCDIGSDMERLARDTAIANAGMKHTDAPSRETCAECGHVIPEARRQAIPGVTLCVKCQTGSEEACPK